MSDNLSENDVRRIVRDELSEQMAGLSTGGSPVDPDKSEVEQMAESVMTVRDLRAQERGDYSAIETLRSQYAIDATEYNDRDQLAAAVRERREGSA